MDEIFFLKLLLSFLVGGSWVIFTTIFADKFGAKVGGLIAGLPSTLLFGLFFIGWTQNPQTAVRATMIVPIIGGINAIFLAFYVSQIKKGLWVSLFSSLVLWVFLSFLAVIIKLNNFGISLLIYVLMFSFSYYIFKNKLKIESIAGKKIEYTHRLFLFRGLLGGLVVLLSVFLGKIGGPIIGGLFAMFPAMSVSTLVITYLAHGPQFSATLAKSSMLSAISIIIYVIVVRYGYISLGLIFGTLLAIVVSFLSGYLIYRFIVKKFS